MGTEAFWIPAAVAALGTGAQYANQSAAASRQDTAQAQAIADQEKIRQQAVSAAADTTQKIAQSDPTQIQQKATGDYVSQLRKNAAAAMQPGSGNSSLAPTPGASSRYGADVAKSAQTVQDYGDTTATQMGNIDAATRQRTNEGLAMQDLQTKLNTLGAQSYGTNFVDQLRAQTAGQANPWVSLVSGMLKNGGLAAASGGLGGKVPLGGGQPFSAMTQAGNGLTQSVGALA